MRLPLTVPDSTIGANAESAYLLLYGLVRLPRGRHCSSVSRLLSPLRSELKLATSLFDASPFIEFVLTEDEFFAESIDRRKMKMQVQVHTDNHVNGSAGLTAHVEAVVTDAMSRFGNRVTRVEVHIGDENGHKKGDEDKRCAMEARLSGLQPIAVTGHGASVDIAINAAADKLVRTLDKTLEKKYGAKGRVSTAEFAANGAAVTEDAFDAEEQGAE